jgi:hypothetical protein
MAHINLLPINYRRRTLTWVRLRQWLVAWLLAWTTLVPAWWIKDRERRAAQSAMEPLEHEFAAVMKLQAENRRMLAKLNDVGTRETLLGELQAEPPPLLSVALVSRSARNSGGELFVDHLTYDSHYAQRQLYERQKKDPQRAKILPEQVIHRDLVLTGLGVNNLAIAAFVVALRDAGVFNRVDLKSAVQSADSDRPAIQYLVECRF